MKEKVFSRINILSAFIIFIALLIVGKLFLVQIVHSRSYKELANKNYVTPVKGVFDRGVIYFTEKDGNLVQGATMKSGFKIAVEPKQIVSEEETYNKLSPYIKLNLQEFKSKIADKNDPYQEIANRLSEDDAEAILKLKLAGVYLYREKWRYYPGNDLAAQALGFVAYKDNDLAGRYGMERYFDTNLTRNKDGLYVNFFAEVFANIKKSFFESNKREANVITTIEPTVQAYLQNKLNEVHTTWHSEKVGGIIMNPNTGEIYALAVAPNFNLNSFSKTPSTETFANPTVENVFEFGSVIKPLVMAGAIDAGLVTPDTLYTDNDGFIKLNGQTIYNFDKKGRGTIPMQQVLNQSLNTGMVFVSKKLGHELERKYFYKYQLNKKTGVDLPNETHGLTSNLEAPRDLEYATAAFGQGVAFTPMEVIRAFASLANGGKLVTPHMAKQYEFESGIKSNIKFDEQIQILKPETSATITSMLVTVVDKGILHGAFKNEHYTVAAKTGTAQVAKESGGGYYDSTYMHSLIGYFPAYNPQFVMFLFNYKPIGATYSATTLTQPFMDTTKFLFSYYNIPPDR